MSKVKMLRTRRDREPSIQDVTFPCGLCTNPRSPLGIKYNEIVKLPKIAYLQIFKSIVNLRLGVVCFRSDASYPSCRFRDIVLPRFTQKFVYVVKEAINLVFNSKYVNYERKPPKG